MHELEHPDYLCRNQSRQRACRTSSPILQDRLVKELRLQGICSMEAANDFAEAYRADITAAFGSTAT